MNKTDLIQKIKQLEGLTQDERSTLIELVNTKKKYGLVWEDKPEEVEEQLRTQLPVLKEVVEKRIIAPSKPLGSPLEAPSNVLYGTTIEARNNGSSTGKTATNDLQTSLFKPEEVEKEDALDSPTKTTGEAPNHILIEGDNLHALTALTFTHEGKIDVMYFDPPYNTGSTDWKYNNDYVDKEDGFKHSKWLSFMNRRLLIAKRLLKPTGSLICTIDENEYVQLGLLLQEIFNDKEIVCVTIIHNPGGIQGKNFSYTHEYAFFVFPKGGTYISNIERDDILPVPLRDWGKESSKRTAAKNCFFPIYIQDEKVVGFGEVCSDEFHPNKSNILTANGIIEIYPIDKNGIERKWRFSRQSIETIKDELLCKNLNGEFTIVRDKREYRWKTVWDDTKYNANVYGTKLLGDIIKTKFPFPKSLYAVKDCLKAIIHNRKDSIFLDIFAGSGTTLHATMLLNAEDGGNRQCILVTNNENNICEEVTYERNRRVIEGYTNSKGQWVEGLRNNNLRYYKSEFVGREPSLKNKRELTHMATELLCIKENCYKEQPLPFKHARFFANAKTELLVIYDDMVIPKAVEYIKSHLNGATIKVYVFSMGSDPYTEDFYEVSDKIELCALPDAIYKAYRGVLPKNKAKTVVLEDESSVGESINQSL